MSSAPDPAYEHQPVLSVIVPVYNAASYLGGCLDSLLDQGIEQLEIILVNDGSTDDSLKICQHYADQDPRIRLISQANAGQSSARNRALDLARGSFVTFVDSDDYVHPGSFALALETLEQHPECDQVQFPAEWDWGSPLERYQGIEHPPILGHRELFVAWLTERHITWTVWGKIYRRSLLEGLRFVEGIIYEDNLMVAQMLEHSSGICFCPYGCYRYIWRPNSTTKRERQERACRDMLTVYGEIDRILRRLSGLEGERHLILSRIALDVWDLIGQGIPRRVWGVARPYLRALSPRAIWQANELSIPTRLKMLLLYPCGQKHH